MRRARADGRAARIAEVPLHVELHVVAVGAEDLHAVIRHPRIRLRGEELRHRDLLQRILAAREHPGRAPHHQARGLELGLHVGEQMRHDLVGADRPPELLPLFRIVEREIQDRLHAADIPGGGADALDLQAGEHYLPALVLAAEEPLLGHLHVGEENLVGAGAAPAEHVELAQLHARRVVVHQEERHALAVEDAGIRLDVDVDDIVLRAGAGGPELLPVDHPLVAIALCTGAHGADVGAGVGLGHRD